MVRIKRKFFLDKVGKAIITLVAKTTPHPRLFAAVFAERHTGRYRNFRKRFACIVVIEQARRGIVRHINVRPPIAIVVAPNHPETVVGIGVNVHLLREVRESAIAVIMVKAVARSREATWAARDRDAAVLAKRSAAEFRKVVQIEIHLIRNAEVQEPVAVLIPESGTRAPTSRVSNTGH